MVVMLITATLATTLLATALPATPPPAATSASQPEDARLEGSAAAPDLDERARREFRLTRAAWQIGAALGAGFTWYQWQIELNKQDFDFDRTWDGQWRRLTTSAGYRFDNNNLTLNVGHSVVGGYYHLFARSNGGGMLEALLFDTVTSSAWEVLVEHREVVSLNDQVTTIIGGVSLGENLYRLGDYFARSEPTVVNRVAMSLLSPAHFLAWVSGDAGITAPSAAGSDARGLADDAGRRFALHAGATQHLSGASAEQGWDGDLRLDLELVSLASYTRAAERARTLGGGEFTRLQAAYVGSRQQMSHFELGAQSSMWGRYYQKTTGERGTLTGHATFIGTATGFELAYDDRGRASDFLTAIHMLGPAVDTTLMRGDLRFRLTADAFGDFALVRPLHLAAGDARPRAGMKSTLQENDYYYALGVTTQARVEAAHRRLRTGLTYSLSHFDSIEGLDRRQHGYTSPTGIQHQAIRDDGNLIDQRVKVRV